MFLLSLAGLSAQVGWITISLSRLMFRRKYIREGGKVEDLKFKTPLYPVFAYYRADVKYGCSDQSRI